MEDESVERYEGLTIVVGLAGFSAGTGGCVMRARRNPKERPGERYFTRPDGMFVTRTVRGGKRTERLSNFVAVIVEDRMESDGAETRRTYSLDVTLGDEKRQVTVTQAQFRAMRWPTELFGLRAIIPVGSGHRERLAVAIQETSGQAPIRQVHAHTGWHQTASGWRYLHGGGAIGGAGAVRGVDVQLPSELGSFVLPDPPTGPGLIRAVQSVLRVLEVAPSRIAVPVLASPFAAVLGGADYSVHLFGRTGGKKTELATLAMQHFGGAFNSRSLPGYWFSSAAALEQLAYVGKDAVTVIDELVAAGGGYGDERVDAVADRVFRAQGNRNARRRLGSDGKLRAPAFPRGLIVSTGEYLPRGHSLRARLVAIEVFLHDVDVARLTECQRDACAGLYAQAMAGYLQWLAGRYDGVQAKLPQELVEAGVDLALDGAHGRTIHNAAHLDVGISSFLSFGQAAGAISSKRVDELAHRCSAAISDLAREQERLLSGEDPARRFLELLASAITCGRAHLRGGDGDSRHQRCYGWEMVWSSRLPRSRPFGELVGWLGGGDDLYLEPRSAFAVAQRMGRDTDGAFSVSATTLRCRLRDAGLLVSIDSARQTLTVRRTLDGVRRDVLHLRRSDLPITPRNYEEEKEDHKNDYGTVTTADSEETGNVA